jgi:FAD:protein FMN transferase
MSRDPFGTVSRDPGMLGRRSFLRIAAAAGVGGAVVGGGLLEFLRQQRLHRVEVTRIGLGTPISMAVIHSDPETARQWVEAGFQEIERLESVLSRYRADSALAQLNRDGRLATPPQPLAEVLERALYWSAQTGGAFDPTIAPVLELHRRQARLGGGPTAQDLGAELARVGWEEVRRSASGIEFNRPDMALTLDGIAKGYVVDRVVAEFARWGADRVLVEAGGDLATLGVGSGGSGWQIGIQDPRDPGQTLGVLLQAGGGAVASSGGAFETFSPGSDTHHIVDPRTGRSPQGVRGVTVAAANAMDADALSTAVFVLGPEAGLELLDRIDDAEGMVVGPGGEIWQTKGFRRRLA